MKKIITATAPTVYQLNSLAAFNLGHKKNGNGSFTGIQTFENEEAAKEYLKSRADLYNEQDPEGSPEKIQNMYNDIQRGSLRLDAVTAHIEDLQEEDNNN